MIFGQFYDNQKFKEGATAPSHNATKSRNHLKTLTNDRPQQY